MIHHQNLHGSPPENGGRDAASSRRRELAGMVEALTELVSAARRAADESLSRVNDAPQPHSTDNSIFVALWEAHLGDREALFSAMRRLDDAREALRRFAAGIGPDDRPPQSIDRRKAG